MQKTSLRQLRKKYLEVLKKPSPSIVDGIDFVTDRNNYVKNNPDWEKTYSKNFYRIYIENKKPKSTTKKSKNTYNLVSASGEVLTDFNGVER